MGEHIRGDIAGERPLRGDRYGLRAVPYAQVVGLDQHLHAADGGERREQRDLAALMVELRVAQQPCQLLHEIRGLAVVEVHLPVARHQRDAVQRHSSSSYQKAPRAGAGMAPCAYQPPPAGVPRTSGEHGQARQLLALKELEGGAARRSRCARSRPPGSRGCAPRRRSRRRRTMVNAPAAVASTRALGHGGGAGRELLDLEHGPSGRSTPRSFESTILSWNSLAESGPISRPILSAGMASAATTSGRSGVAGREAGVHHDVGRAARARRRFFSAVSM